MDMDTLRGSVQGYEYEGEEEEEDADGTAPAGASPGRDAEAAAGPSPGSPPGLREVGGSACWAVSSAKPGNGVDCLRDGRPDTYWQ
jgi:hypothetical protein